MKLKITIAGLFVAISMYCFADPVEEGKSIFTSRCSSCHNINKLVVGPALAGVDQRRSIDWIIKFVQSSQTLIKSGDKDAAAIFAKFNITMPDHPDLTASNIKSVVDYIKSQAAPAGTSTDKAPFSRPEKLHPAYLPISIINNYGFFLTYLSAVALLVFVLLTFVRVKEYERNK
jgi:Cytochrome c553